MKSSPLTSAVVRALITLLVLAMSRPRLQGGSPDTAELPSLETELAESGDDDGRPSILEVKLDAA